ncbi:MAG: hypothetical protein PF517_00350, partial [Salinivirgaceae bacterium]|nr:hypothetical protein [Salinivirgaceae bacterium]
GIAKPRYAVGKGDYLYISCLGENPDWDVMPDSYIAKFNVTTNTVEDSILISGGPEGLAIANNKLYVALNYADSIAVVSLNDESVSYIQTSAFSSYFLKDENENLYVSLVRTTTDSLGQKGLGYINTTSNTLEDIYQFDGVSSEYSSIFAFNNDYSKIYIIAAQYENYNLFGSLAEFDVENETFSTLIGDLSGPKGVSVKPETNEIYLFLAESVVEGGLMKIYTETGDLQEEYAVGNSPIMSLSLN